MRVKQVPTMAIYLSEKKEKEKEERNENRKSCPTGKKKNKKRTTDYLLTLSATNETPYGRHFPISPLARLQHLKSTINFNNFLAVLP